MDAPISQGTGLTPGDLIAGKFRLERVIGRGGMGAVWAARHVQLQMPVALKFIEVEEGSEADLTDARARFEREARAAGQIRSPHVVQIIDHGIDGDRPYIAMELLEGEDLGERLRRERRISVPAAAKILSQCAKALRRAHEAGIIHRDLKPGNVFLARFDDDEVVKILDFGVAKMRRSGVLDDQQATQVGIVFGSPSYMSPEQARGARALDHRSDLWSLAVIIFRAVTGVKPFHGATIADLVIKLCIDPLPVATQIAPDLPPQIDTFFARAFARDPDQRFASAMDMAAALEAVAAAAGAPVPPVRTPVASRTVPLVDPPSSPAFPFARQGERAKTQPLLDPPASAVLPFAASQPAGPAPSVTPPPTPVADPTPASGSSFVPSVRRPPLELASLRAAQTPRQQREPWVLMAILGGALLIAIVLAMVAKPAAPATTGEPASPGEAASELAQAPEPPKPSLSPEPPQTATVTASTTATSEPKPHAPAQPSGTASGGALPPARRWGKKKPF